MARRAFGEIGFLFIRPARAGNIEMDPRRVAGELAYEHRGGDGPSVPATRIRQVCDRASVELAVLFVHRQLPHSLADGGRAGQDAVHPLLLPAEYAGGDVTESNRYRSRERGRIDEHRAANLLGVSERIRQDEPALGVGVQDFDRLAGHGSDDVARLVSFSARHILRGRYEG